MIGGAGPSSGMVIAMLTDWSERKDKEQAIDAVLAKINAFAADIPDANIFAMAPPLIDGYGVANGFEIYLQDRAGGSVNELYSVGQDFIAALSERPEIGSAYTTFNVNFPQYLVEVDAVKCQRAGTTADAVLSTLAGYYSGQYVSNFNRFNKLYRVMIQSSPEYRVTPESLDRIFTRVNNGVRIFSFPSEKDITRLRCSHAKSSAIAAPTNPIQKRSSMFLRSFAVVFVYGTYILT